MSDNASQMVNLFTSSDAPVVEQSLESRAQGICGPHSEAKAKQVVDLFRAWDADGDGAISRKELRRLMRFATDGKANDVMLDALMAKADSNGNGQIEFEEFAAWVFKQKIGMFSPDVKPSRICAAKSPVAKGALVKWFQLINVNKNPVIEYEEFAIACMYLEPNVRVEDIDDEFDMLDPDGARRITLDRFVHEYSRLLDAIPRPIEEKVEFVNERCQRLDDAMKASRSRRMSQAGAGGRDLQDFLQRHYASVGDALKELGWKNMEDMNIVQFRDALREVLGLPSTAPIELETLRRLFRELDKDNSGTISVQEIQGPQHQRTKGATNRRAST